MSTKFCANENCGRGFEATHHMQKFCPECREKKLEEKKQAKEKTSVQAVCTKCGAEYTQTHHRQKFCPACKEAMKTEKKGK